MKLFKSLLSLLLVLLLSNSVAIAQQNNQNRKVRKQMTSEERAQKQTDRLTKSLSLDAEQAKKAHAINLKYGKLQQELMGLKSKGEQKSKYKQMREDQNAEYQAILTEEQKAIFNKKQERRVVKQEKKQAEKKEMKKAVKRANTPETKAESRTNFLHSKLSLTEEQMPKVQAINVNYYTKLAAMKADLKAKKIEMLDRKGLKQERNAELKKVLTPEQFNIMLEKPKKKK